MTDRWSMATAAHKVFVPVARRVPVVSDVFPACAVAACFCHMVGVLHRELCVTSTPGAPWHLFFLVGKAAPPGVLCRRGGRRADELVTTSCVDQNHHRTVTVKMHGVW